MNAPLRAPGPKGRFGLGNVYRFALHPLEFLRSMVDTHGDVVKLTMLGTPWFILANPEHIEEALVKKSKAMGRDAYVEILQHTLGLGLLTSEGDLWKRQRKLMAQAFSPRRIRSYAETMAAVGGDGMVWGDGAVVNLHDEMSRVTMEVVAAVLFGAGIAPADVATVHGSMSEINAYYANSPEAIVKLPLGVPTPRHRRLKAAVSAIDDLIYRIIGERRDGPARQDLLGTLLSALDEGGTGMTDRQLRDEAVTLFLAGHETTALALAHTLYLVSKYPDVQRRLEEEIDRELDGELPGFDDVERLVYTRRVIDEGMRLYPPAWTTGREALEDVEIGGYSIPKGAQVLMSEWVVHRDPRWFDNPEAFDPDRWLPERAKGLPRFAYFPFGGGPRTCIGNHFAMMEAVLLLAIFVQRHRLELLPGQRLDLRPSVTLRPAGPGLRARIHARRRASNKGHVEANPAAARA